MLWHRLVGIVLVSTLTACSKESKEEPPSNDNSPVGAGTNAPVGSDDGTLRCGDFISKEQAASIGLDAYDDTAVQKQRGHGVHCGLSGNVSVSLYPGSTFKTMGEGIDSNNLERLQGPTVGKGAHWYTSSGLITVIFLSTNGKYAAAMNANDQPTLERVAKAFEPYLNR